MVEMAPFSLKEGTTFLQREKEKVMEKRIAKIADRVLEVVEYASKIAKDINDFRSILSQRAMQGDLDDAYNSLQSALRDTDEYIRTGSFRAPPED